MSTEAVRLSEAMFGCWVTRASDIKEVSKHPAFRVSESTKVYLSADVNSCNLEQILTTIATHMIKRTTALFAPYPSDRDDGERLKRTIEVNKSWIKTRKAAIRQWNELRIGYREEGYKHYLEGRTSLLDTLAGKRHPTPRGRGAPLLTVIIEAGKKLHEDNYTLDKPFKATHGIIKEAREAGIDMDFDTYESYVHVDSGLMENLDKIYREQFQQDDGFTLSRCFNITEDAECHDRLTEYIKKVKEELEWILCRPESGELLEQGDPHEHGIKGADARLDSLFAITDGRICLPLATPSMLDDLKEYVLVHGNVIIEVRSDFPFMQRSHD